MIFRFSECLLIRLSSKHPVNFPSVPSACPPAPGGLPKLLLDAHPFRSLLADPGRNAMRTPLVMLILCLPLWTGEAQTANAPYLLSGSFSVLSNSFNGVPGSRQPLLGWNGNAAFPPWHNLRFVLDYANYQGTNLGIAPARPLPYRRRPI